MASHISCPTCGKATLASRFPASSPIDVVGLTFRGLGKGHGFAVADRSSLLDDPTVCEPLASRLFETLRMLKQHGHFTDRDLLGVNLAESESDAVARESDLERRVSAL